MAQITVMQDKRDADEMAMLTDKVAAVLRHSTPPIIGGVLADQIGRVLACTPPERRDAWLQKILTVAGEMTEVYERQIAKRTSQKL